MQLTVKAIEKTQRRYMDANQHRPWQIMHGLVGLRRDLELREGNRKVNAIEWLSNGATFRGQHWFEVTEHGAVFVGIALFTVVPALAGMWIGLKLQDRTPQRVFQRATLVVLIVAGLNLIRRGLLG